MKSRILQRRTSFIHLYYMAILGCFLYVSPGYSFDEELRFTQLTTEQGLSNFTVSSITQDWQGFIWIGTQEGLNRFDGQEMKVYKKIIDNPSSLSDNQVSVVYADSRKDLWVGTKHGICRYNRGQDNYIRYSPDPEENNLSISNSVVAIDETADLELMIALEVGFLYRYKPSEKQFVQLSQKFGKIKDFLVDSEGKYWVGGDDGLEVYNPVSGERRLYNSCLDDEKTYPIQDVYTIFEEGDTLWIGTSTGRTFYLLQSTGKIQVFDTSLIGSAYVSDISKSQSGSMLFSTMNGLHIYDKNTDQFSTYKYQKGNSSGLNASGINTVYEDAQHNLWVGTQLGGVNFVSNSKKFNNYNEYSHGLTLARATISSLCEDSQGRLWVGSFQTDISVLDPENNTREVFVHNPNDPFSLGEGSVFCLYEDSRGNMWVGTYDGYLQRFDPKTGRFISYPFSKDAPTKNRGTDVRSIYEDGEGMIWICSHGNGVSRLNPETREYKHYLIDEEDRENTLADNYPFQILQGNVGYFWIATPSGLSRFDRKAESFKNYYHQDGAPLSMSDNFVNVLFEDSNQKLWVGTKNGLCLFDRKSESFQNFYDLNGLPHNDIKAILEHKPGELWITTSDGLSRMRYTELKDGMVKAEFRNYDESDNLQDVYFWDRSAIKLKDNTLLLGCKKGIIWFDPDEIIENTKEPVVFISNFRLGKRLVKPGPGSVLKESIGRTKKITLKHNQNFFSFDFVAMNYIANEKNEYKYKLEGYDPDWVNADGRRTATYSNVEPGEYVFRVIASNNDGVWNELGVSVSIEITPAITGTWWFRILAFLVFGSIILLYFRSRVISLRRKNVILEEKVEERIVELSELNEEFKTQNDLLEEQKSTTEKAYGELEMYKTRLEDLVEERTKELIVEKEKAEAADRLKTSFLTNLSHEIRTPLNSIIGFSGLIFDPKISEKEKASYKQIIDGSNNALLGLINDIIDFAKMESGDLKVVFQEVILDNIFENLQQIYSREIKKQTYEGVKGFEFRIRIDERSKGLILITDEVRIKQVLTILINNAIKFTMEGYIEVGSSLKDNKKLEFYVQDTGIGIEEVHHQTIFDRFRKVEDDKQQIFRGAGIGLSIARELSLLLGGEMSLQSKLGEGSRFSFTIPLVNRDLRKMAQGGVNQQSGIPDFYGKKIMVAEDDHSNFVYLQKLLLRTNAEVLHAKNGAEAVKIYEQNPDLCAILMDIKMPVMNGMEALLELKEMNITIPVIAQTAYAFNDEVRKIRDTGFSDYLTKPISTKELYTSLNKHIGNA